MKDRQHHSSCQNRTRNKYQDIILEKDFTNKRACRNRPLTDAGKETNRRKSRVRAIVEHPFRPPKSIYGFAKARYRGLVKNANQAIVLLALINLDKWGLPLTGQVRPV